MSARPTAYRWDPQGVVPPQVDALMAMDGTNFLGTLSRENWDQLTDSGREYISYGLKLIAEWATEEEPWAAVSCILSSAVLHYQMLQGRPSPWKSRNE